MFSDHTKDQALRAEFENIIRDERFPCIGAKAALSKGTLRTVSCWKITSAWDDLRMHAELMAWAAAYKADPAPFRSLAFIFGSSAPMSEERFEAALWERVQSLTNKDTWLGQSPDQRVSADPADPHFSLSFGGEAFFVVGLHPRASRPARRLFKRPVLVFNLHDQFEWLRNTGKYEPIREKIIARDIAVAGHPNPMLARHGEASEARQYSGRAVGLEWKCPFTDPRKGH